MKYQGEFWLECHDGTFAIDREQMVSIEYISSRSFDQLGRDDTTVRCTLVRLPFDRVDESEYRAIRFVTNDTTGRREYLLPGPWRLTGVTIETNALMHFTFRLWDGEPFTIRQA